MPALESKWRRHFLSCFSVCDHPGDVVPKASPSIEKGMKDGSGKMTSQSNLRRERVFLPTHYSQAPDAHFALVRKRKRAHSDYSSLTRPQFFTAVKREKFAKNNKNT